MWSRVCTALSDLPLQVSSKRKLHQLVQPAVPRNTTKCLSVVVDASGANRGGFGSRGGEQLSQLFVNRKIKRS